MRSSIQPVYKRDHLFQAIVKAGYIPEKKGICVGLSLIAMQSILTLNFLDFKKKLAYIHSRSPETLLTNLVLYGFRKIAVQ